MVYITSDVEIAEFQNPCSWYDEYYKNQITIIELAYKGVSANCEANEYLVKIEIDSLEEAVLEIQKLYAVEYCDLDCVETPFNGYYDRTTDIRNGYFAYDHIEVRIALYVFCS